jgi:DNA-binding MarR family transcriptional regulator
MAYESAVQREIKQTKPFRSPAQEALIGLFRTVDVLRRQSAECLEPEAVTPQQYNVLRILRGAGPTGLPTLEIASRMIERAPGITRLIDRLETKGLVSRERCPDDRRQVTCRISEPGLSLLARLDKAVAKADQTLLQSLTVAEQKQLIRLLDRIRAAAPS